MTTKRRFLVIGVALLMVALLLGQGAETANALDFYVNAIGYYPSNPLGTRADIQTANPTIRDVGFGYSWARATVQNESLNYYAEIGWMKLMQGSTYTTLVHVTSQSASGHWEGNFPYYPTVGSYHNYSLLWNSSLNGYDLRYDGTYITNRPASYNLTRVFSGGEAFTSGDAIGISYCLNNQFAVSGGWMYFPTYTAQVSPGYWVKYNSWHAWQVGGNN